MNLMEQVRLCAYYLWLEAGCPSNNKLGNWLKAREIIYKNYEGSILETKKDVYVYGTVRFAAPGSNHFSGTLSKGEQVKVTQINVSNGYDYWFLTPVKYKLYEKKFISENCLNDKYYIDYIITMRDYDLDKNFEFSQGNLK